MADAVKWEYRRRGEGRGRGGFLVSWETVGNWLKVFIVQAFLGTLEDGGGRLLGFRLTESSGTFSRIFGS